MAKHKAKKGRPAKPYENPAEVALNARMKHTGLSKALAATQEAGTVVGRLRLAGAITEPLYEAAKRFYKEHTEAMCTLLGPVGLERTNPGTNADEASDKYVAWAIAAVASYQVAKSRLNDVEWAAIEECVLEDREPHNLADLKAALICCAKGYGLIGAREAA